MSRAVGKCATIHSVVIKTGTGMQSSATRGVFWKGAESHAVWSRAYPIVWGDRANAASTRGRTEGADVAPGLRSSIAALIRAVDPRGSDRAS